MTSCSWMSPLIMSTRSTTTGLKIEGSVFNDVVKARACTPSALDGRFDIVVLAVKAQHTAQAIRSIEPHLSTSGSSFPARTV